MVSLADQYAVCDSMFEPSESSEAVSKILPTYVKAIVCFVVEYRYFGCGFRLEVELQLCTSYGHFYSRNADVAMPSPQRSSTLLSFLVKSSRTNLSSRLFEITLT